MCSASSLRIFLYAAFETIPLSVWLTKPLCGLLLVDHLIDSLDILLLNQKDFSSLEPKVIWIKVVCLDFVYEAALQLSVTIRKSSHQGVNSHPTWVGECSTLWWSHVPSRLSTVLSSLARKLDWASSSLGEHKKLVRPVSLWVCVWKMCSWKVKNRRGSSCSCLGKINSSYTLYCITVGKNGKTTYTEAKGLVLPVQGHWCAWPTPAYAGWCDPAQLSVLSLHPLLPWLVTLKLSVIEVIIVICSVISQSLPWINLYNQPNKTKTKQKLSVRTICFKAFTGESVLNQAFNQAISLPRKQPMNQAIKVLWHAFKFNTTEVMWFVNFLCITSNYLVIMYDWQTPYNYYTRKL